MGDSLWHNNTHLALTALFPIPGTRAPDRVPSWRCADTTQTDANSTAQTAIGKASLLAYQHHITTGTGTQILSSLVQATCTNCHPAAAGISVPAPSLLGQLLGQLMQYMRYEFSLLAYRCPDCLHSSTPVSTSQMLPNEWNQLRTGPKPARTAQPNG